MPSPVIDIRSFFESLHHKTGEILVICSRMMVSVVVLGAFFALLMLGSLMMVKHPEQLLQMQSFQFNYTEQTKEREVLDGLKKPELSADPNWDGAMAGFSMGSTVGRAVPVIGEVVGPVFGLVMGYELDKKV